MTGSTPWIGDSRNWSGLACAPLGRKSSGRKIQVRHPASGIVPPHRESIATLSEKANLFSRMAFAALRPPPVAPALACCK